MYAETKEAEHEMLIIMNENQNNNSNHSTHSFFSKLCSFDLNDMGFGLNRISPITFDGDAFQTSDNRSIHGRAPTSTPRERGAHDQAEQVPQETPIMNKMHPLPRAPHFNFGECRHQSYNADTSARTFQPPRSMQGKFMPP